MTLVKSDLNEYFIQPYYYKVWLKIDKRLRGCIYETQNFKLDSDGYLVEDDNGETGIQFLRKNIDKLKFKTTKKDEFINVLQDGKKKGLLFTKKFVIIPPFIEQFIRVSLTITIIDLVILWHSTS